MTRPDKNEELPAHDFCCAADLQPSSELIRERGRAVTHDETTMLYE